MYHETPGTGDARGHGYFSVPADRFEAQLLRLRQAGFRGVSLEAALERPRADEVAITFDDGHASNYHHAFPILRRHECTATFFVTTSWVGSADRASWNELREMAAAGMSIQSHTDSHAFLSQLDADGVVGELGRSKARLDRELGQDTRTLALPGGDFPRRPLRHLISEAGYRILATSRWGPNEVPVPAEGNLSIVRRYTVRRETSEARFEELFRARSGAGSFEGLRLRSLSSLRSLLGADRYSRWRRAVLGVVSR